MNKIKLNSGIAALILIVSFLTGWGTFVTALVLMLLFAEVDEKTESLAARLGTFIVGYLLFSLIWSVIDSAATLIIKDVGSLADGVNLLVEKIAHKYSSDYFTGPATTVWNTIDSIVTILMMLTKFGFVVAVLSNKPESNNFIAKKIRNYVNMVFSFINNIGNGNNSNFGGNQNNFNGNTGNMPNQGNFNQNINNGPNNNY